MSAKLFAVMVAIGLAGCVEKRQVFEDAVRPGGASRGNVAHDTDNAACTLYVNSMKVSALEWTDQFRLCMRAKGWRFLREENL